MEKEKFRVEIIIRGVRKLDREQQDYLSEWIQNRGRTFKKEDTLLLANKFSYRLPVVRSEGRLIFTKGGL